MPSPLTMEAELAPTHRLALKIYRLAVHHGLIAAAPPELRPRSQPARRPKPESETMGWAGKLFFGIAAVALIGALTAALNPVVRNV